MRSHWDTDDTNRDHFNPPCPPYSSSPQHPPITRTCWSHHGHTTTSGWRHQAPWLLLTTNPTIKSIIIP